MLAPVVAVLMTVVAYSDGTPPEERHTEPMAPSVCAKLALDLTMKLAASPPASERPVLAWSVTCQMERTDARAKL